MIRMGSRHELHRTRRREAGRNAVHFLLPVIQRERERGGQREREDRERERRSKAAA